MLSQTQRLASIGARQIAFYIETKDKISYYVFFMQLIDQDRELGPVTPDLPRFSFAEFTELMKLIGLGFLLCSS